MGHLSITVLVVVFWAADGILNKMQVVPREVSNACKRPGENQSLAAALVPKQVFSAPSNEVFVKLYIKEIF